MVVVAGAFGNGHPHAAIITRNKSVFATEPRTPSALTSAASQVLQTLLFGVTAHDPRALAAGVLALAIVSALAIAIPARQAAGIDPIEAIRGE